MDWRSWQPISKSWCRSVLSHFLAEAFVDFVAPIGRQNPNSVIRMELESCPVISADSERKNPLERYTQGFGME